jgi:hypothetical protein
VTAPAPVAHHDQQRPASGTPIQGREPSTSPTTDSEHLTGDPRALLALRLLAAAALLVTAIDEPTWLLTKAVCALAELTVIALWAIRRIAPSSPPE